MLTRSQRFCRKLTSRTIAMALGAVSSMALASMAGMGCQSGFAPITPAESRPVGADKFSGSLAADGKGSPIAPAGRAHGADAGTLQGFLTLAPAVASKVSAGDTIFVMARHSETGKMMAVTRLIAAKPEDWPMAFSLEDERMTPGMRISLSARVDKDGDASSKNAGDLVGEMESLVSVPASKLTLTVGRVL